MVCNVLFLYSWKGGNGFSTRMVPKLQITSGEAEAEQVEATSKSELSMSTLQQLVCNLDYAGARKPDIFRITTLAVAQIHSGTKFKAAFEIYFGCRQRQETLDLPYLTLLCDNLKNRMFLQNFFSWPYFGNVLYRPFNIVYCVISTFDVKRAPQSRHQIGGFRQGFTTMVLSTQKCIWSPNENI
jgi:hypothetical protein